MGNLYGSNVHWDHTRVTPPMYWGPFAVGISVGEIHELARQCYLRIRLRLEKLRKRRQARILQRQDLGAAERNPAFPTVYWIGHCFLDLYRPWMTLVLAYSSRGAWTLLAVTYQPNWRIEKKGETLATEPLVHDPAGSAAKPGPIVAHRPVYTWSWDRSGVHLLVFAKDSFVDENPAIP
jgi:hypothetical protein